MMKQNKQKDDDKVFYKDKRYQGFAIALVGAVIMIFTGSPDPEAAQTFVQELQAHIGEIMAVGGSVYGWAANWYERVFK